MSLYAVGDAVDSGHVGTDWQKNTDADLKVSEVPGSCKKCKTPWPCATIIAARTSKATFSRLQYAPPAK